VCYKYGNLIHAGPKGTTYGCCNKNSEIPKKDFSEGYSI
jgi:hypothetical protein